jgi:peptide/nickel transport system permease protein
LWHVVRLNFGDSIKHRRPVIDLIAERLPVTLALNIISFVIIYAVSIPTGVLAASRQGRFFDRFSSIFLLALWSLPIMWVAQMLIGYFAGPTFKSWFPPAGLSSSNADRFAFIPWFADRLWHLILPVFCLTYTGFAYLTRQVRSAVLENLRMDYVRAARAKGLTSASVITRHVLPNSLMPLITIAATLIPALFAGSVIVERIFGIHGMGLLMFEAVANRDYNVIMAVVTIAGILNSLGLLLADLAYAAVDPRVDFQSAS